VTARYVSNRGASGAAPPGLLPDAERLERARHFIERWRSAGLVECAVVRSPIRAEGRRVWLALESMQVTGSFKVRGALFAMEALGAPEVIAASAGNHGAGVAYASEVLGAKATVVVPATAARTKVEKIAAYGANVVYARAPGYDGAEREAVDLARTKGLPFVSPYDDLDVLTGNGASLGFEIVRALGKVPDVVLCPLGGGGLATGLACALAHDAKDPSFVPRVAGVQIEASPAFAMSVERGAAVTELPPAETLAEGLEGGLPERAFARVRAVVGAAIVVDEASIRRAMRSAVRDLGLVLEGSAAAALAALPGLPARAREEDVVVVLTGRNVDRERLAEVC
jgi:threonine dehydratase